MYMVHLMKFVQKMKNTFKKQLSREMCKSPISLDDYPLRTMQAFKITNLLAPNMIVQVTSGQSLLLPVEGSFYVHI